MTRLLIATHNIHKAAEFRSLLEGSGIEVVTLDAFPSIEPVDEDEPSLEGNALKKARHVFEKSGLASVADDTGLEVYYLNGEPGVYSSRYSGPGATYDSNCRKLLGALQGVPPRRRRARFRCVLAFVAPPNYVRTAEGICEGTILEAKRGTQGFGYDPLFLPAEHRETFAEMIPSLKNRISHRGRALEALKPELLKYFTLHP